MRTARRATTLAVVTLAVAAAAVAAPAVAGSRAVATAGHASSTGSWGVAASAVGQTPTVGSAHSVTWTPPLAAQYLSLTNTGTLGLTAAAYTITNSKPSSGSAPEIALEACVGATWNASAGTCAGTVVRLATTSGGAVTATSTTVPAAGGAVLSARLLPVSMLNFPQSFSSAVSVAVTRAQARAATTTRA